MHVVWDGFWKQPPQTLTWPVNTTEKEATSSVALNTLILNISEVIDKMQNHF